MKHPQKPHKSRPDNHTHTDGRWEMLRQWAWPWWWQKGGGCSRVARNTLIKYKLTIKLLQIYANICSESTPHTGGKLMGKHLSYAGSTRGLRILPGGGGFALCRLPYAVCRLPCMLMIRAIIYTPMRTTRMRNVLLRVNRKQITLERHLWNSIKRIGRIQHEHLLSGQEQ